MSTDSNLTDEQKRILERTAKSDWQYCHFCDGLRTQLHLCRAKFADGDAKDIAFVQPVIDQFMLAEAADGAVMTKEWILNYLNIKE